MEQGKNVRSPPEEEGPAEMTCKELTTAPVPHPLEPLVRGRRKFGTEVEPRN